MNLPANQQGVLVEQVESGSPAEQAGLQAGSQPLTVNGQSILVGGDIITAVDGQPVTQVNELRSILQQDQPGQQISLTILRNGAQTDLQVTLGEQPTSVP
jgi:S1-C subfamily serine protease